MEDLSLKMVQRNKMRNSEGDVGFGKNTWLLFRCFDFEQFMRSLGDDFLGSLENGVQAGVRGWAEDAVVGIGSYRKCRDKGRLWRPRTEQWGWRERLELRKPRQRLEKRVWWGERLTRSLTFSEESNSHVRKRRFRLVLFSSVIPEVVVVNLTFCLHLQVHLPLLTPARPGRLVCAQRAPLPRGSLLARLLQTSHVLRRSLLLPFDQLSIFSPAFF